MEAELLQIKDQIEKMESLWENSKKDEAFILFTETLPMLQKFILWIEREHVLSPQNFEKLVVYLYQAIENKDHILLEDVMCYGVLDIVRQLLGIENEE